MSELAMTLTAAEILNDQNGALTLSVPVEYRSFLAQGHSYRTTLENLLLSHIGRPVALTIQTSYSNGGTSSVPDTASDERNRRYNEAQNHPLVMKIMKTFHADIIGREPSVREEFIQYLEQGETEN